MFDEFPLFDAEAPPPLAALGGAYNELLERAHDAERIAQALAQCLRRFAEPLPGFQPTAKDREVSAAVLRRYHALLAAA